VQALVADAFVAAALAPHGYLRPAFDFDALAQDTGDDPDPAFIVSTPFDAEGFRGTIGVPTRPVTEPAIAIIDADGYRARVLTQPGRGHAIVGLLRTDRDEWDSEALATAIEQGCDGVTEALLSHIGHIDTPDPSHDRSVTALLEHAACQLTLQARPDGTLMPMVERTLAERILRLPLFPARRGGRVGAWLLVRRFCAHGGRLDPVARELAAEVPEHLRNWLATTLHPANIHRVPSQRAAPVETTFEFDLEEATPPKLLGATVTHHLHRLRPDRATSPLRFFVTLPGSPPFGDDAPLLELRPGHSVVDLNGDHWLVRRARDTMEESPKGLAWLLLACYAHINDLLDPVVNDHEREFQRRVLAALEGGELDVISDTGQCA
jgi:hypothetical protein